jgi:hypothetical protein
MVIAATPPMNAEIRFLPGSRFTAQDRRSNYDVTNLVKVSSVDAVRDAVQDIFQDAYPDAAFDLIWMAFHDFGRLFSGQLKGYSGCDTLYHDTQHSLDMTLTTARLLAGYERSCAEDDRLGHERAIMGLITALFHDSGYIRRVNEASWVNGAEFTIWHVSRSADFLNDYFRRIGMGDLAGIARQVVHFTGYEIDLDDIELDDPKDSIVGHLLGTADLIAQMADRCYLEKCRDRLYSEFVLGGIAIHGEKDGQKNIRYESGIDLLRKTPIFFSESAKLRLDGKFNRAYRYIEALYDGRNPYLEFVDGNFAYLQYLIESDDWTGLRRSPPVFTVMDDPLKSVSGMVSRYLARLNVPASAITMP